MGFKSGRVKIWQHVFFFFLSSFVGHAHVRSSFPDQGPNLGSLQCKHRVLTAGLQGSSRHHALFSALACPRPSITPAPRHTGSDSKQSLFFSDPPLQKLNCCPALCWTQTTCPSFDRFSNFWWNFYLLISLQLIICSWGLKSFQFLSVLWWDLWCSHHSMQYQ